MKTIQNIKIISQVHKECQHFYGTAFDDDYVLSIPVLDKKETDISGQYAKVIRWQGAKVDFQIENCLQLRYFQNIQIELKPVTARTHLDLNSHQDS